MRFPCSFSHPPLFSFCTSAFFVPLAPCLPRSVSLRNVYSPNSRALGTLYVDYLAAQSARDRSAKEERARQVEEQVTRNEQAERQETAQTLTKAASVRTFDASARVSFLQQAASHPQEFFAHSDDDSDDDNADSAAASSSGFGAASASPIAAGLLSLPIAAARLPRHTVSNGSSAAGGKKRAPVARSFSSFSVGVNKPHTWQEIAHNLKQDSQTRTHTLQRATPSTASFSTLLLVALALFLPLSPFLSTSLALLFCCSDVGFTPFLASAGETVMTGKRLRELSMMQRQSRIVQLDQHAHQAQQ